MPGGDIDDANYEAFVEQMRATYPRLDVAVLNDYTRNYATRMLTIIGSATSMGELGMDFGGGLNKREVDYLMQSEWTKEVDDILWRRTKKSMIGQLREDRENN